MITYACGWQINPLGLPKNAVFLFRIHFPSNRPDEENTNFSPPTNQNIICVTVSVRVSKKRENLCVCVCV